MMYFKAKRNVNMTNHITGGSWHLIKKDNIYNYELSDITDKTYKLKIELTGDCYIGVSNVATGQFIGDQNVYKEGQTYELEVKDIDAISINLGATNKAKVYVNDVQVDIEQHNLAGQNFIVLKLV